MSALQIIYQITLPERMIGDTFEEFMRDEYFPAVHKGPTRTGQVIGLSLLRGLAETHEGMTTIPTCGASGITYATAFRR